MPGGISARKLLFLVVLPVVAVTLVVTLIVNLLGQPGLPSPHPSDADDAVDSAIDATVTINLMHPVASVAAYHYGTSITGYGQGEYITNSETHRGHLRRLGLGLMRIELRWTRPGDPTSRVACGGTHCAQHIPGEAWVRAIRELGAEPMVILPLNPHHSVEIDIADAVNLYEYLASRDLRVRRFIVGNEPDNSRNPRRMDAEEYSRRFNLIADALHELDPQVQVGGPATMYYNTEYLDTFLRLSGSRVDFVDFHKYGQGGEQNLSDDELLGTVIQGYRDQLADLRHRIQTLVPDRAHQIGIQIGEYQLDWDGDPRMLTPFGAVWSAAVLGTILSEGAVAVQYGDRNGELGLTGTAELPGIVAGDPLPIYHGISMFTGAGQFRSFGQTMVRATSSTSRLYAFASVRQTNIVLVNTAAEPLRTRLRLEGREPEATTAQRWELTEESGQPQRVEDLSLQPTPLIEARAGRTSGDTHPEVTLTLPPRSVTTLVIDT